MKNAGLGWESRIRGERVPGLTYFVLAPKKDWHEMFMVEHFDIRNPLQRFVTYGEDDASGNFGTIEAAWFEVQPGHKLYLRNIRLRNQKVSTWQWPLAVFLVVGVLAILIAWRWTKRRRNAQDLTPEISPSIRPMETNP